MADILNKLARSVRMSKIRAKDTKPEMLVRRFLHANGFRYGLHSRNLPGTPDMVLRKHKTVIFVHGCFWHMHGNCKFAQVPKTRSKWWTQKFERNAQNDNKHARALRKLGWKVIVIWECSLKPSRLQRTLNALLGKIG